MVIEIVRFLLFQAQEMRQNYLSIFIIKISPTCVVLFLIFLIFVIIKQLNITFRCL